LSDPTTGNRWFAASVNPAFPFATTFLGEGWGWASVYECARE